MDIRWLKPVDQLEKTPSKKKKKLNKNKNYLQKGLNTYKKNGVTDKQNSKDTAYYGVKFTDVVFLV
jgi:hypothetical protein